MTTTWETLQQKILSHKALIGVIGLGYVGSALADLIVRKGYPLIGFEKNKKKNRHKEQSNYFMTTDTSPLKKCDIIIICVQTPIYDNKTPNFEFLNAASKEVGKQLQKGQLVTIESSINPGVTRNMVLPFLQQSGLRVGEDFALAFSPERIDPGNKDFLLEEIPKVVSGFDATSLTLIQTFYQNIFNNVVPVSSLETAEMVKIFENTFRFINISLVNELKEYSQTIAVDLWEVINAAATKPFGFLAHYPSPGVGGHCIPVDPFYLYDDAKKKGIDINLIHESGVINDRQPHKVVDYTLQIMDGKNMLEYNVAYHNSNDKHTPLLPYGSLSLYNYKSTENYGIKGGLQQRFVEPKTSYKILLIGVAYKPDIDDVRESPAIKIWELFEEMGHTVSYHDPYISTIRNSSSLPLSDEVLADHDIIVIVTNHTNIDYTYLAHSGKPIIDTRHVYTKKLPNIFYV